MKPAERLVLMLAHVANGLGPELIEEVVFVGGCVVGLLVTDPFTSQQLRNTEDVDLIVDVISKPAYFQLQKKLRLRGFRESMEDDVQCRWRLGELVVDVMPVDEDILGFSNFWYRAALDAPDMYSVSGFDIKVVSPPLFLVTKIEAYRGRGRNDMYASRDIEDIINLLDGRSSLAEEVAQQPLELRRYIVTALESFLTHKDFDNCIESACGGDVERVDVVYERIAALMSDVK